MKIIFEKYFPARVYSNFALDRERSWKRRGYQSKPQNYKNTWAFKKLLRPAGVFLYDGKPLRQGPSSKCFDFFFQLKS